MNYFEQNQGSINELAYADDHLKTAEQGLLRRTEEPLLDAANAKARVKIAQARELVLGAMAILRSGNE